MSLLSRLRSQSASRWRAIAALVALVSVVGLLLAGPLSGDDDESATSAVTADTDSSTSATSVPAPTSTPAPDPSGTPKPTSTVESEAITVAPEPTEVPPLTDCLRMSNGTGSESDQATDAVRDALNEGGDVRCFGQDLAILQGDLYRLPLVDDGGDSGGALAIKNVSNNFDVVLLGLGPWNSYMRIGGNEGRDAPAIAGLPSGRVLAEYGGYSVEVSGTVYLYGESETTTFYWITAPIFESWVVNGADTSLLGSPASSVYTYEGLDRVDFEGGFITHNPGDRAVVNSISVDRAFLPANADMRGRLISARDGTGWFVDDQDRRWWIPNGQAWFCAGGDVNAVASDAPGYAIHRLTLGGIAPCPLGATGTNPRAGGVEIQRYCETQVDGFSKATEIEGGWACELGSTSVPVTHAEICTWQYGEAATTGDEAHPFDWTCSSN